MTPNRPGIRFGMTAWPSSGEIVAPSDSKCGQTRITPTATPCVLEIGQASKPLIGSMVPFKALVRGSLNMS